MWILWCKGRFQFWAGTCPSPAGHFCLQLITWRALGLAGIYHFSLGLYWVGEWVVGVQIPPNKHAAPSRSFHSLVPSLALPLTKGCISLLLTFDCFNKRLQASLTPWNHSLLFILSFPAIHDEFIKHLIFTAYLFLPSAISQESLMSAPHPLAPYYIWPMVLIDCLV